MSDSPHGRKLRIALVTGMFPVPHDKTRGRYIFETAAGLSRIADVRVFFGQASYARIPFLTPRSGLYERLPADYVVPGIDVEAFEYPVLQGLSRPFNGLLAARRLLPRVREFRPDVVLGYWIYPDGYAAVRVAKALRVPSVVGALGSDVHVPGRINEFYLRRVIRSADAMLTVSCDMRSTLLDRYGAAADRTFAVVNGFNGGVFHPRDRATCRRKVGIPADCRMIVYVGRLYRAKGLVELLDAYSILAKEDPSLRLVFVGDGVMKQDLAAMIERAGHSGTVLVPGGAEPDQVADWIGASDLLCLPSWSEGYPNVVVEAAACGRPVVATDVGGTSEIVRQGNGMLVPPRDVPALAAALSTVLARSWDPESVSATVRRSWDDVAAETLAVCERLSPLHHDQ